MKGLANQASLSMLTNRDHIPRKSEAKKLEKFKSYFKRSDSRRASIPMPTKIFSDTKRSSPLKVTIPNSELRNKKYNTLEESFVAQGNKNGKVKFIKNQKKTFDLYNQFQKSQKQQDKVGELEGYDSANYL